MSQSRARKTRRDAAPTNGGGGGPAAAQKAVEGALDAPETGEPGKEALEYPGVLVVRVPGEQPGNEQIQVIPVGGMDILAVPTLLEYALKLNRTQLGLEERS